MPKKWPEWWDWELELTPHLIKRMEDRDFNEVDLRTMLQCAHSYRKNIVENRWVIETRHKECEWEIIVELDVISRSLVVITAYPVWED